MDRRTFLFGATGLPLLAKFGRVEIGLCGSADNFEKAERAGFDYYEPSASAIAGMTDAAFASFRDRVLASKIRCRSFNGLIRSGHVVGPDVNLDAISQYLDTTLDRCKQLGAKIAVWGSASSRNVPDGFSREEAWSQMKTYLKRAGEIAKSKQIVIGIEPLRKQESNIINSGAEALKLLTEVNHPNVQMIIDYYHMRMEKEDSEIVRKAREHIVHIHFANPTGRKWPKSADEDPEYHRFFQIVKEVKYEGGISIEGSGSIDEDASASIVFFHGELTG